MILDAIQCPLCDAYIVDGRVGAGQLRRFVHRMDLHSAVCSNCDARLGPDSVRVEAMRMSGNPAILEDYLDGRTDERT